MGRVIFVSKGARNINHTALNISKRCFYSPSPLQGGGSDGGARSISMLWCIFLIVTEKLIHIQENQS